ncbi:MAG: hypothetical protein CR985_00040 [Flavobacteriales bacterium]|nr:MAG: hypothetical protein CR985_00040 [Flavobacteriales bacterium]
MQEQFLHYIWNLKLCNTQQLATVNNEQIIVKSAGEHNTTKSGPDFFNAKIAIGGQLWAGNVEIHVKSSDWYLHNHQMDENYDAVILHVVWEYDAQIFRSDNTAIPTLCLKDYVPESLIKNYQELMYNDRYIYCEKSILDVDNFLLNNWLEKLYIQRLAEKATLAEELLKTHNNDYEAVLFLLLAKNFGLNVNGQAFFYMLRDVDFSIIRKLRNQSVQLEALLFGRANLLNDVLENNYYNQLQEEYKFIQKKFNLKENLHISVDFFRLRPNNFPTIRLAQLAALYGKHQQLFSEIINTQKIFDYYKLFKIQPTEFWQNHYSFTSPSKKSNKYLSKSFIDLLLINTIIPLKFSYLKSIDRLNLDELFQTVTAIKSENNSVIARFNEFGIKTNNALESQAVIQLKNKYCNKKRCLQCDIGNDILRN